MKSLVALREALSAVAAELTEKAVPFAAGLVETASVALSNLSDDLSDLAESLANETGQTFEDESDTPWWANSPWDVQESGDLPF